MADEHRGKQPEKTPKRWLMPLLLFLSAVAVILYLLADRYLIEHVEVKIVPTAPAASSATDDSEQEQADSSQQEQESDDKATEWTYQSQEVNIQITQEIIGSGQDQITYYVADVELMDTAVLQAGFAKNAFGRNIIENTSTIAQNQNALFAINGDYYGFRSDGVIIRNGTLYREEPVRDALAILQDGSLQAYAEGSMTAAELLEQGVLHTYSFGPVLVADGQVTDGLEQVTIDTNFGNRSIQAANPRTGIGMIEPGHLIFIVVDGRSPGYSKGMTLQQFAQVFADLGCVTAYNLDGGGSSTMYFNGRVVNNPLGKNKERGVSDILFIAP